MPNLLEHYYDPPVVDLITLRNWEARKAERRELIETEADKRYERLTANEITATARILIARGVRLKDGSAITTAEEPRPRNLLTEAAKQGNPNLRRSPRKRVGEPTPGPEGAIKRPKPL